MDKTELLISLIERVGSIREEMLELEELDPVEIEGALDALRQCMFELEILME